MWATLKDTTAVNDKAERVLVVVDAIPIQPGKMRDPTQPFSFNATAMCVSPITAASNRHRPVVVVCTPTDMLFRLRRAVFWLLYIFIHTRV